MAKFGTGKLYGAGWRYGADPQYITGVGSIPSAEAWGMLLVSPGPVLISGAGNIPTAGALGTPWIFRIPQKLALGGTIRQLSANPQINRLKVTLNG